MPEVPFPARDGHLFFGVTGASPSGQEGADGTYFSAYGFYKDGDTKIDEGVHVFRLAPTGVVTEVTLPEARPGARGILCIGKDGIYLWAWKVNNGALVRMKVANLPPPAQAPVDPRIPRILNALGEFVRALLGMPPVK